MSVKARVGGRITGAHHLPFLQDRGRLLCREKSPTFSEKDDFGGNSCKMLSVCRWITSVFFLVIVKAVVSDTLVSGCE